MIKTFLKDLDEKKRNNKQLTFLVIPETTSKTYRFNISTRLIKSTLALVSILILITVSVSILFYGTRLEISGVNELKRDNASKAEAIELLNNEIELIEAQKEQITKKQNEIKKLMGIKEDEINEVQSSEGGQGGADIKEYPKEQVEVLNRLQDIKTYLNRQEQELDELIAQVDNKKEYFRSIPNQWPVAGEITSPYGWRKSPFGGRGQSFHDGIDIANNVGTEIMAAADGKVIFSGYQAVYGRTVIIDHGYGFNSKYSHNSALLVEEGDRVKKGDVIAKLGNTGRSTGPHLHFTVTKWGVTLDPLIYLP